MDPKTQAKVERKLRRQAALEAKRGLKVGDWGKPPKKNWNDKCLEAFLKVRPLVKGADPDVHCKVLLIIANATKGSGISAGHIGRLADRLFDSVGAMLTKSRKYDELTNQTEAETDVE